MFSCNRTADARASVCINMGFITHTEWRLKSSCQIISQPVQWILDNLLSFSFFPDVVENYKLDFFSEQL